MALSSSNKGVTRNQRDHSDKGAWVRTRADTRTSHTARKLERKRGRRLDNESITRSRQGVSMEGGGQHDTRGLRAGKDIWGISNVLSCNDGGQKVAVSLPGKPSVQLFKGNLDPSTRPLTARGFVKFVPVSGLAAAVARSHVVGAIAQATRIGGGHVCYAAKLVHQSLTKTVDVLYYQRSDKPVTPDLALVPNDAFELRKATKDECSFWRRRPSGMIDMGGEPFVFAKKEQVNKTTASMEALASALRGNGIDPDKLVSVALQTFFKKITQPEIVEERTWFTYFMSPLTEKTKAGNTIRFMLRTASNLKSIPRGLFDCAAGILIVSIQEYVPNLTKDTLAGILETLFKNLRLSDMTFAPMAGGADGGDSEGEVTRDAEGSEPADLGVPDEAMVAAVEDFEATIRTSAEDATSAKTGQQLVVYGDSRAGDVDLGLDLDTDVAPGPDRGPYSVSENGSQISGQEAAMGGELLEYASLGEMDRVVISTFANLLSTPWLADQRVLVAIDDIANEIIDHLTSEILPEDVDEGDVGDVGDAEAA